jgi:hypothetical protein
VNSELGFVEDISRYWDHWYNFTDRLGITDVNDPVAQQWEAITNPVTGDVWGFHNAMTNVNTTPLRKGITSNSSIDVSGGGADVQYFVSARYQNSQGAYPTSHLEQTSLRANITAQTSDELTITVAANYMESDIRYPESSRSFRGYSLNAGTGEPLASFGVLPDGSQGDCLGTLERGDDVAVCEFKQGNLLTHFPNLNTVYSGQEVGRFVGSATARWTPTPWLANRIVAGVDHIATADLNSFPLDPDRPFGILSAGYVRDQRLTDQNRTYEYTGTITLNPEGVLASTTTFGAQYFTKQKELVGCIGEGGFASLTAIACDAGLIQTGFSNNIENKEVGVYAQQRFGYKGYLYGTVGFRFDDNSAFGANQGGIWSPSANASAVLSDMPFWNENSFINSLRLRFAWGKAAQAPPNSAALRRFVPVRLTRVGSGTVAGVSNAYPGNPDLGPERKSEIEFGFDAGLLDDRLEFKATYFSQETTDAIISRFLAPSFGYQGEQFVNVGKLTNNGIEMSLSAQLINTPSFSWDLDVRASTQDPIVTDLGGQPPIMMSESRGVFQEGFAPGSYYGPIITAAKRGSDGKIVEGSIVDQPGDLGLKSNPTYSFQGSPQAKNFQNLSTTITLFSGKLRIATLFDRKGDVTKRNESLRRFNRFPNRSANFLDAFREGGDCKCQVGGHRLTTPIEQAAMERSRTSRAARIANSQVFNEDGSFIKWRELTVTYQLPESMLEFFGGNSASITFGGRNLFTWTNYMGADPEIIVMGGIANMPSNETFYGEALTRRWFTRVNLQF